MKVTANVVGLLVSGLAVTLWTQRVVRGQIELFRHEVNTSIGAVEKQLATSVSSVEKQLATSISSVEKQLATSVSSVEKQVAGLRDDQPKMRADFATAMEQARATERAAIGASIKESEERTRESIKALGVKIEGLFAAKN